jgi:hypothetical protein
METLDVKYTAISAVAGSTLSVIMILGQTIGRDQSIPEVVWETQWTMGSCWQDVWVDCHSTLYVYGRVGYMMINSL